MKNRSFLLGTAILILLSFVALAMAQGNSILTPPDMPAKMKTTIQKSLQNDKTAAKTRQVIWTYHHIRSRGLCQVFRQRQSCQ